MTAVDARVQRVVCGWCGRILDDPERPIEPDAMRSHGICERCKRDFHQGDQQHDED